MFTGIVEEIGSVMAMKRGRNSIEITIKAKKILEDLGVGHSVAVNGVCLTAKRVETGYFMADIMKETVERTALNRLSFGSLLNLERALKPEDRLGGHMVLGHVDATGKIMGRRKEDISTLVEIAADKNILSYVVEKGSIAIDGISLTVVKVSPFGFTVSIIPHTANETTLLRHPIGTLVNLECDITGKYIEKMYLNNTTKEQKKSAIDEKFLIKNGFI